MHKARSIWYSGGGEGLGIFFRAKKFFRTILEQDYFFRRHFGPDYFFYNQKLWYTCIGFRDNLCLIQAFATTTCLIQAFATTSCSIEAFATNSHSIQVFALTAQCSRNNQKASYSQLNTLSRFSSQLHTKIDMTSLYMWTSLTYNLELF